MKKASPDADDLRPEYDFDYARVKPNRFAPDGAERTVVVLDEDLSKVFTTAESVNKALHALINAIPVKSDKDAA